MIYRRYTNFAKETVEVNFNGTADFGKKVVAQIPRNGDLMHEVYLKVELPAMTQSSGDVKWTRNIGHVLIDNVTVNIGGQQIDKHYGDWLNIYAELSMAAEKEAGYNVMIGNTAALTTASASIPAAELWVPFQFWFN